MAKSNLSNAIGNYNARYKNVDPNKLPPAYDEDGVRTTPIPGGVKATLLKNGKPVSSPLDDEHIQETLKTKKKVVANKMNKKIT